MCQHVVNHVRDGSARLRFMRNRRPLCPSKHAAAYALAALLAVTGAGCRSGGGPDWTMQGWERAADTGAADLQADRSACIDEVVQNRQPMVVGTVTPALSAIDQVGRADHMATCMRGRGWLAASPSWPRPN